MDGQTTGGSVRLDDEGYLVEPGDWNEEIAARLARSENVDLTDDHWKVLRFMREYYQDRSIAPDARFTIRFLADVVGYGAHAKKRLCELFPYGYVKQACKIAGMKRPRAWSTG
ncbi:MAG: TusE/DsrC/DsvC family sulfur relay protein [Burkholderiales bacterium]